MFVCEHAHVRVLYVSMRMRMCAPRAAAIVFLFGDQHFPSLICRYDIENKPNKTEDDKNQIQALYKQFGKWHGISSLLNLIITGCAVGHGE